ncbi:15806_t:CDS:2 [Gigaspora margarita]|uniref:15806_t:CDS:1 n=1 Tax=Gigaspora margarita TaxID=4874 RepID=A0ABN7VD03_GIGMA|nr:15806_t:CDS:2 [Gigaspora margarita]
MTNERTILLIGRTGNSRSTIANMISNTKKFKESEYAISESEEEETLHRLANTVKGVQNGLNQIFFVISEDIGKYTTIIQTKFSGFRDPEKRRKNKEVMRNQNENIATILSSCCCLVHVNNLTEQEDSQQRARNDSRAFLRNYLSSNCQNVYIPSNLGEIDERIQNYLAKKNHGDDKQIQINQLIKENQYLREQLNNFATQQGFQRFQNNFQKFFESVSRLSRTKLN